MGTGQGKIAWIALLGAVACAVFALALHRERGLAETRLREDVRVAHMEVTNRVETFRSGLKKVAHDAAMLPQLRAAIDDGVDAFTLKDLFDSEDWWVPFKTLSCALFRGPRAIVVRGTIGTTLGEAIGKADSFERTVAQIAAEEATLGTYVSAGRLYLSAASAVPSGKGRHEPVILVVGQAVDDERLKQFQLRPALALVLKSGDKTVAGIGDSTVQALVEHLPGSSGAATFGEELGWGAASVDMGTGVRLWVVLPRDPVWVEGLAVAQIAWALSVLLAVLGIVLLLRQRVSPHRPGTGAMVLEPIATHGTPSPVSRNTAPSAGAAGTRPGSVLRPSGSVPAVSSPSGPPAAATMMRGESQPFGRYTLLERIGEGGMSELFTAILPGAEGFERHVVIKRLKPHLALDPAAVAQFIDEAKCVSQLVHSNIVPVFDFGKVGDGYFLAQEFIDGKNLAQVLETHLASTGTPIPAGLVCYIAQEILAALAYAHNSRGRDGLPTNLVHRDISPSNVMSSFEGEIKLLDFGIVKADARRASTDPGNVKGNAAYMSPEQARGQKVDQRSDLFSLALVMFDLLTGERFYQGNTTGEVLYQAATGPTADHVARLSRLPPAVGEALRPALSLDPAGRYPNAQTFSERLAPHASKSKSHMVALMRQLFP